MTWGELAVDGERADRAGSRRERHRPDVSRSRAAARRRRTAAWVTATATALALLSACARDEVETVTDLSPPSDMEECDQRYVDDKIIDYTSEGDFAKACVDVNGELATPIPARLACTDGRHLVFNDYAWGFENDVMTRFRSSDRNRLPPRDVTLECLMEEE